MTRTFVEDNNTANIADIVLAGPVGSRERLCIVCFYFM